MRCSGLQSKQRANVKTARANRVRGSDTDGQSRIWLAAAAVAVAGIAVSGYLLISAVRNVAPVCFVGACAEVAASPYSRFLGVPNAAFGVLMYLAVAVVTSVVAIRASAAYWASLALFGLAVFGAVFSAYLAWLQLAVLKAVCVWCALSAALWLVLLVFSIVIAGRSH